MDCPLAPADDVVKLLPITLSNVLSGAGPMKSGGPPQCGQFGIPVGVAVRVALSITASSHGEFFLSVGLFPPYRPTTNLSYEFALPTISRH